MACDNAIQIRKRAGAWELLDRWNFQIHTPTAQDPLHPAISGRPGGRPLSFQGPSCRIAGSQMHDDAGWALPCVAIARFCLMPLRSIPAAGHGVWAECSRSLISDITVFFPLPFIFFTILFFSFLFFLAGTLVGITLLQLRFIQLLLSCQILVLCVAG